MALPTPAQVRAWTERYGSPEAAADVAEQLPEWKHVYVWGKSLSYWERVAAVLEAVGSAGDGHATAGRWSNPIPRVPLDKAAKRLATKGASRNAIANMEGLTRRKADWIVGWFEQPDGLSWSERDGVRYPRGTRFTEDGTEVRLPPLLDPRRADRARPPAQADGGDEIRIW